MSIVSLNARGLRNVTKHKALFLFVIQLYTDFCFCQESHSILSDVNFWRSQWGNETWFSHCTERSAGVLTMRHGYNGDILHTDTDPKGHLICQVVTYNTIFGLFLYLFTLQAEILETFFLKFILGNLEAVEKVSNNTETSSPSKLIKKNL